MEKMEALWKLIPGCRTSVGKCPLSETFTSGNEITCHLNQWRREGIYRPGQTSVLPPPPSGVFRNLKGTFQVYIFRSFQILAYFHSKYQYNFFHIQRCPGFPARYAPGLSNQIGNWYSYGYKDGNHAMVWTVNSTLSWGVYNCLTQWNVGLGWSIVIAKKLRKCLYIRSPQTS